MHTITSLCSIDEQLKQNKKREKNNNRHMILSGLLCVDEEE